MFTGIVEEIGSVSSTLKKSNGIRLSVKAEKIIKDLKIGDSVAVNGVCLTAVEIGNSIFDVDVSFETISKSNIGYLGTGNFVNLERALRLSDRLSGHIVLGHVDSKGIVYNMEPKGDFYLLRIKADSDILRYCINKGSIAIDGISLTISSVKGFFIDIAVIPHTFNNTNLKYKKHGDYVNIEADVLGKYVEKIMKKETSLDENFLKENGFL